MVFIMLESTIISVAGDRFSYCLEPSAEPELVLTLPDRTRYVATQINVAQGNRTAVMLNASRRGVGGAIDLECLNLPEGVELTPIQMPANQSTVPFLLSASKEAPLDGRLVNVVGRIPDNPIEGRFSQQHQMLIGLNNNVVNDYYADRAAIAVIKAMPCTIEVVAPRFQLFEMDRWVWLLKSIVERSTRMYPFACYITRQELVLAAASRFPKGRMKQ